MSTAKNSRSRESALPAKKTASNGRKALPPLVIPDVSGMTCKEAAHAYLDAGLWPIPWRVFKGKKMPCYRKGWSYDTIARETHESIDKWRDTWQVGLITSPRSGIIAIDVDDRDEFNGWDVSLTGTAESVTGREGGYHLVYDGRELAEWPKQGDIPGGQVKTNGFIGVEPSIHPNGNMYEWYEWSDWSALLSPIGNFGALLAEYRSKPARGESAPSGHSGDSGDLWEAVLEAGDTKQRGAIFAWSRDAHDRGLSDDEIIGQLWLAVLEKGIKSWRPGDPWNRAGLREAAIPTDGWKHTVNGRMDDEEAQLLRAIRNLVPRRGKLRLKGQRADFDDRNDDFDYDETEEFEEVSKELAQRYRMRDRAQEINLSRTGNAKVFAEVDWDTVKPRQSIPLDEDGVFLTERIHWISGQAGDGKTILGYWKLVQYAKRKVHSAIYECEMGEDLAMGLLRNLGATDRDLRYIHYFKAEADGTVINLVKHGRAFCQMLIRRGIKVLIYDALNPLLVAAALNENIAADVRAFVTSSCYPMSVASGLVLVIDHMGQLAKDRARGSSDKAAAGHVDITLRKVETFARGIPGAIELTCNKDRTGSIMDGSKLTIRVESRSDGTLRLKPDIWDWEIKDAKPKVSRTGGTTQQKLIEFGRDLPDGFTIRAAAQFLGLSEDTVGSSVGRGAKPDKNGEIVFKQVKRGLWIVVAK